MATSTVSQQRFTSLNFSMPMLRSTAEEQRSVRVISTPTPVHMADEWFELATLNHFWIRRRFSVCRKLLQATSVATLRLAEIGCGNGLVQRQFEDQWNVTVDGFDLNMPALQKSHSRTSSLYYYDVHERRPEFQGRYDLILLFDVLEHIQDDQHFLESVCYHLKKTGSLFINVPANNKLYSSYDIAAGHVRRYDASALQEVARRSRLRTERWTYWGMPLYPLLVARKRMLRGAAPSQVIATGFSPRNWLSNFLLSTLSKVEMIPQHVLGTSLMALLTPAA